jgi:hypothetical protein
MLTMSGFDEEKAIVILEKLHLALRAAPPELQIQAYNLFLDGIKTLTYIEKLTLLYHFDAIKDNDARYLLFWFDLQALLSPEKS